MTQLNWNPTELLALQRSERERQMQQICLERMVRRARRTSEIRQTPNPWTRARAAAFGMRQASAKRLSPVLPAEAGGSQCVCTD